MRIQCQIIFVNYIRWLDANEPRKHFFFRLVPNHKKALYSVVVSHGVKFSTLTIFKRPYCSFQRHLDGLVGRCDLAVFV